MQISVQNVFNLAEGLTSISEKELPIAVAFKLQRINRLVGNEYNTAQKTRSKLLEKYKEKDLENGKVKLKEEKLDDFNKEIDELMNQKVKIDIQKISIDELKSTGVTVTPKTLGLLHAILKEEKKND
ncbi:hypothetical protein [Virgibacillus doumboii]|uniref:hypothetical protein n=1 Tax=Virgibacillus doumboii TaxID=2697503 RepID=UPI0013E06392|nr:hypothetical protein [Virgibacillus doumboii]